MREFDPAWLRDNCQCAECRDPVSGQRLISITDQLDGVRLADVTETADGWRVRFEPDGHESRVTRAWLDSQLAAPADGRTEDAKQLWSAADFPSGPPAVSWADYLTSDAARLGSLRQLLSAGFMLLRGVPAEPGAVLTVAASMGYVRETNYGRLFDVRVEATPANLAFTGLPIGPHTDNPYRDPVPTLQLLHCLVSAADGGESGLLDGFRAAGMLRADDPAAFDFLTTGSLQMAEFYRSYRALATTLLRPDLTVQFSLEPGDCVVFDNTRVLHSRTGFTATGHRHLQGCYADIDGVESTVAVLARPDAAALAPVSIDG